MPAISLSSNTYAGKKYAEYLTPALLSPKGIVQRKIVTPIEGIKNSLKMLGVDLTLELKTPSAAFSSQAGQVTRNEKELALVPYELQIEIDYEILRTTWESEMLKKGSMNDYLGTPELSNFIMNRLIVPKLAIANEQLFVLGKTGVTGVASATFSGTYNGYLADFEADGSVRKYGLPSTALKALTGITTANPGVITVASTSDINVGDTLTIYGTDGDQQIGGTTIVGQSVVVVSKTATTLTTNKQVTGATPATSGFIGYVNAGNVIGVLSYVYGLTEDRIRMKPDSKILFGTDIEKAYRLATANVATGDGNYYGAAYFRSADLIPFLDMACESMPYWKPNTVAVWNPDNVFLGMDLISDEVSAQTLWLGDVTGDMVYRIRNRNKTGVEYKHSDEILFIRPA